MSKKSLEDLTEELTLADILLRCYECKKPVGNGDLQVYGKRSGVIGYFHENCWKKYKKRQKKLKQEKKMEYETTACKTCEFRAECVDVTLVEPLKAPECPHEVKISVFKYRQCLKNNYLAHLGSY